MPKFNVVATFSITTEVEPEFWSEVGHMSDHATDGYDNSSFGTASVECDGGELQFAVVAEDEADAERIAEQVISEGEEVEDRNGFTWLVQDLSFDIEKNEMTKHEALAVIQSLLTRLTEQNMLSAVEREAFDVLIQDI